MSYHINKKEEGLTFKQIALNHYNKLLELSLREFRNGYWNVSKTENSFTKTYITDAREEFIQGIRMLSHALYPYFDNKMKKSHVSFLKRKKSIYEMYGGYGQEDEEYGIVRKQEYNSEGINTSKSTIYLIDLYERYFRSLSCLMHRLDYFKGETYSEGEGGLVDLDKD
jgi:hypothetical protein